MVVGRAAMGDQLQHSHNSWKGGTALIRLHLSPDQGGQEPGSGGRQ